MRVELSQQNSDIFRQSANCFLPGRGIDFVENNKAITFHACLVTQDSLIEPEPVRLEKCCCLEQNFQVDTWNWFSVEGRTAPSSLTWNIYCLIQYNLTSVGAKLVTTFKSHYNPHLLLINLILLHWNSIEIFWSACRELRFLIYSPHNCGAAWPLLEFQILFSITASSQ